jgi:hypothetical protein
LNGKISYSKGADMAVEAIKEFSSDHVERGTQETGGLLWYKIVHDFSLLYPKNMDH